MLGRFTSSIYVPLPRMKRGSSLRLTEDPIPWNVASGTAGLLAGDGARVAQHRRRGLDRLHDVHVAGAAAEVARDAPADLLVSGAGVGFQQRPRGHDHARGAEAA